MKLNSLQSFSQLEKHTKIFTKLHIQNYSQTYHNYISLADEAV